MDMPVEGGSMLGVIDADLPGHSGLVLGPDGGLVRPSPSEALGLVEVTVNPTTLLTRTMLAVALNAGPEDLPDFNPKMPLTPGISLLFLGTLRAPSGSTARDRVHAELQKQFVLEIHYLNSLPSFREWMIILHP